MVGGRWGRMRVLSVMGVVVRGWVMVRGRSGSDVVKRMMRVRGGMEEGGAVEDIVVCMMCIWVAVTIQMLVGEELAGGPAPKRGEIIITFFRASLPDY